METFNLTRLNDLDTLQEIQDRFSEATGLAAVTVDYSGKPVTKYSKFSSFCAFIREIPEYRDRCFRCDAFGGLEAARRKKPYIYTCHSGLTDFAIPIIVADQYLGSLLVGQARLTELEQAKLDDILSKSDWDKYEEAREHFAKIQVTNFNKVFAAAEMMSLVVNNFVKQSMHEIIEQQLQKKVIELNQAVLEKEQLEKEVHVKELQSGQLQLNPYFLLGILNTASRLSIIEDAPQTGDVIFSLSEYSKYVIKHNNSLVSLQEELNHIRNYFHMQSFRFEDRFRFECLVPADMLMVKIPALILQALVENAFLHGLLPTENGGTISISASSFDQQCMIEISDDGVGMDPSLLNRLQPATKRQPQEKRLPKGISFAIIRDILAANYGEECSLSIQSHLGEGTTVTISVPKRVGDLNYA